MKIQSHKIYFLTVLLSSLVFFLSLYSNKTYAQPSGDCTPGSTQTYCDYSSPLGACTCGPHSCTIQYQAYYCTCPGGPAGWVCNSQGSCSSDCGPPPQPTNTTAPPPPPTDPPASCSCQAGYHCDGCGTGGICYLCVPDHVSCQGYQCGTDPIDGTYCGGCNGGDVCVGNTCVVPTQPCVAPPADCTGVQCGTVYNACGDPTSCGGCGAGQVCTGNTCCNINCSGKVCGSDSCGGSCGSCTSGKVCSADQSACVTPTPRVPCTGIECGTDPIDRVTNCGGCPSGDRCVANKCVIDLRCSTNAQCQAINCTTCSFGTCIGCTTPSNTPVPTACPFSCGTAYCGVVTDSCGAQHDCSGNSCTAPEVCNSPYCVSPTPTFPPWTKLKDSSFQSAKDLSVTIPANPVAFDSSDSGSSHFIEGTGLVSNSASSLAQNQDSASGWQAPGYTPSIIFTKDRLLSYVNSKKEHTNLTTLSADYREITQSGIYYIATDITLTQSPSVNFSFVLISGGTVTIQPQSGNSFAPAASVALVAPAIAIDSTVSNINAILIANTIDTGTSNTSLKINGNLIAQSSYLNNRTSSGSQNKAPSVFIEFNPALYIDLLPYLSIDKYEWKQTQ